VVGQPSAVQEDGGGGGINLRKKKIRGISLSKEPTNTKRKKEEKGFPFGNGREKQKKNRMKKVFPEKRANSEKGDFLPQYGNGGLKLQGGTFSFFLGRKTNPCKGPVNIHSLGEEKNVGVKSTGGAEVTCQDVKLVGGRWEVLKESSLAR